MDPETTEKIKTVIVRFFQVFVGFFLLIALIVVIVGNTIYTKVPQSLVQNGSGFLFQ